MTNEIEFQDLIDALNDYMANYTTGNVDNGQRMRQLNRAIEWWQRRLMLPSDKRIQSFDYYQDTNFYNTEDDFLEPLALNYAVGHYDVPGMNFTWRPDTEILERQGTYFGYHWWSTTTINQLKQMLLVGRNKNPGGIIDSLTQVSGWSAQGDANNLVQNTNQFVDNLQSSLQFNITPSTGHASLYNPYETLDLTQYHQNNGAFKLQTYLPSANLTSIDLNFFTTPTDYYKFSVSVTQDGTPFEALEWNQLAYFFDDVVIVGSPSDININAIRIDFNEGIGFTNTPGFLVNNLYGVIPDRMEMIYASWNKGTDSSGATVKYNLDSGDDIPYFGSYAPDLVDAIAMRAAVSLIPQLRKNIEFYTTYQTEVKEMLSTYGKIYPRKRLINMGKTILRKQ